MTAQDGQKEIIGEENYTDSKYYYGTRTLHLEAFELPFSDFIGKESRDALQRSSADDCRRIRKLEQAGVSYLTAPLKDIPKFRDIEAEYRCTSRTYLNLTKRYSVSKTVETIGGVYVEIFVPDEGISPCNQERVLINLHGGGFVEGGRGQSHLESIPIAHVGKIKVVSIDYRMGPEHHFPAASNDVLAVYQELLRDYKPENIGIYGCSAGALLSAQSVALIQQTDLPLPRRNWHVKRCSFLLV